MTSEPQTPHDETMIRAIRPIVYLGPEDGSSPTEEDRCEWLRVVEVRKSAGGRTLDFVKLAVDLGIDGLDRRVADMLTPTRFSRQIEIWIEESEEDADDEFPLIWGELTIQELQIDDRAEVAAVIARVESYHFGEILGGYIAYDPLRETEYTVQLPAVLNPIIEGKLYPNMSSREHSTDPEGYYLWIDPESITKLPAQTFQDATAKLWTIDNAIQTFCRYLNPGEQFIKNPAILNSSLFPYTRDNNDDGAEDFTNIRVKMGARIPEILDSLLQPSGYNWRIDYSENEENEVDRQIVVFKRGEGTEKELLYQANGETIDLTKTNVCRLTTEHSIADLANVVEAYGSLKQREVTIELYRGWTEFEDTVTIEKLSKDPLLEKVSSYKAYPDAWRLWVANEAGDYCGTRTTTKPIPSTALDLSSVFGENVVPRRRVMEDCLTFDKQDRRMPPVLEYYETSESKWKTVPSEWGYVVLRDQIGVRFTGDVPPPVLYSMGSNARLRITGTITGDERIKATTDRRTTSPNARDVVMTLDLSDRFHDRVRQQEGDFASQLSDPYDSDRRDDSEKLQAYAEKIQKVEESADMRVSILLHGLEFGYTIGDLITRVAGRNISFNRNSQDAAEKRYVQVTGIRWIIEEQRTELLVDVGETDPAAPAEFKTLIIPPKIVLGSDAEELGGAWGGMR